MPRQTPGSATHGWTVPDNRSHDQVAGPARPRARDGSRAALRRFLRNRTAIAGGVVVLALALTATAAPVLAPEDPARQDYDAVLVSPGFDHPLGTDRLGRDTLSRLMYGARTSLAVGIFTQFIVVGIGIPVGAVAGMAAPRSGNLIMRMVDTVYAFPDLHFILLLRAVFGPGLLMMIVAIGLVSWPTVARLVRGQTLSLREREFVLAARGMGASGPHIALHHILPNALGPVIVAITFLIPRAIFAEAALSYIGIGVMPPTPSWGHMVQEGYSVIFVSYGQVLFPTIAIAAVVMAFTFLGEGLRDHLDPRSSLH